MRKFLPVPSADLVLRKSTVSAMCLFQEDLNLVIRLEGKDKVWPKGEGTPGMRKQTEDLKSPLRIPHFLYTVYLLAILSSKDFAKKTGHMRLTVAPGVIPISRIPRRLVRLQWYGGEAPCLDKEFQAELLTMPPTRNGIFGHGTRSVGNAIKITYGTGRKMLELPCVSPKEKSQITSDDGSASHVPLYCTV